MKLTLAIVAVLAMGGAASAATGPYTGPNQPTAQGPQYVVPGADIYEWSTVLGYAVPICDVTGRTDCRPLDVNIVSGGSGGGGGWSGGSTSAPGYVSQVIGGAVLSASNPSDDQLFYNGSAVSGTNGLPTTDTADGSPATAYNYPAGGLGLEGLLSDQVARQTTGNGSLATIATNSGTEATSANQTAGNGSLTSIVTNTAGLATVSQRAKSYALMTASTSAGAVSPDGGGYSLSVNGTFGGSTVTVSQTYNGVTTTIGTYTASLATPLQLNVYQGTTITASTSGGTSPSVNVTLAGGPPAVLPLTQLPPVSASTTQGSQSVTTASTQVIAASTGTRGRIDLANTAATGSGNNAWCSTGGLTAVVGQGLEVFAGGAAEELYPNVGPQAVNCIMATATASIGWEAYQ